MTEPITDRRKFLALGSTGILVGLAGCAAFRDSQGTPADSEPPDSRREGHPPEDPLRTGSDNGDAEEETDDDDEADEENGEAENDDGEEEGEANGDEDEEEGEANGDEE